jgi:hypothetical protein
MDQVTGYVRIVTRAGYTKSGRPARPGRGRVKFDSGRHNLVVNTAKTFLGDLVRGQAGALGAIAVGSDDTAPVGANTTLGAELARLGLPAPGTDTATEKNLRVGVVVTLRQTFTGITGTINECGTFGDIAVPPGDPDEGSLFNRVIIGPDAVTAPDNTTVEVQFTFN